jgi:cytochrome b subunit of formate dehydrogenase
MERVEGKFMAILRIVPRMPVPIRNTRFATVVVCIAVFAGLSPAAAQDSEDYEVIDSSVCVDCHAPGDGGSSFRIELDHSTHEGLDCLDCHIDRDTVPHRPVEETFSPGCQGCRNCHDEAAEEYVSHGRASLGDCEDMPHCSDCHGTHDILPSSARRSSVHPTNLPDTCGKCHENLDITTKYDILIDHPIRIYSRSVHGQATKGGVYVAASCNDCHSTGGSAHKIMSPGSQESSINHFNIPKTCGRCHKGIENDFWEGIHGQLVARGETDAPVCTDCHGEHGILSPDDPLSPVSGSMVAEMTCSPCHESAVLNEKYDIKTGRLTTFIDSYHGLKSKAGDTHVANCASCHGVHRILSSSDPTSTINPANLRTTCGECHPNISEKMATTPIHGIGGQGLRTPAADVVEKIYIIVIAVIIGLMILHWVIDLFRHLVNIATRRPQILRLHIDEVVQHALLAATFITLTVSGFALRYDQGFMARFFFGWEGGFEVRGILHRAAAVAFMGTTLWHILFLFSPRGRKFAKDMMPVPRDFQFFLRRILYNLGLRPRWECIQRFNYVEKAEYWGLVWGTIIMVTTGLMLWFDNWFIQFLPKGVLDIALVIHFWEAWLAALTIFVWHFYSVIFHPSVYPMNPSWITGHMPEDMYEHEHPGHLEEARRETEKVIERRIERMRRLKDEPNPLDEITSRALDDKTGNADDGDSANESEPKKE